MRSKSVDDYPPGCSCHSHRWTEKILDQSTRRHGFRKTTKSMSTTDVGNDDQESMVPGFLVPVTYFWIFLFPGIEEFH